MDKDERIAQLEVQLAERTKERDEALAKPSQHEGAHATCWAEVERLQAALAQAQTDALQLREQLEHLESDWRILTGLHNLV